MVGVYIHIPFCRAKCPYCDFYSVRANAEIMEKYKDSLLRAIKFAPEFIGADTLYFGGGTPSLMPPKMLAQIIEAVDRKYSLSTGSEITVEANPGTVSPDYFKEIRSTGVNRLSMGMQSSREGELKRLGRQHTAADAAEAVNWARGAGFDNISLDIMLGTPEQSMESALKSAEFCAELGAEHVSAYILKIEGETPYGKAPPQDLPDEDIQADIYLEVCQRLESLGFNQYEISNFAKPGYESRHNLKYWQCRQYLGLGPSAHSFYNGLRSFFPRSINDFIQADNPMLLMMDDGHGGGLEENIMMGLRLAKGIDLERLKESFPQFEPGIVEKKAQPFINSGLMIKSGSRLQLTKKGFLVSNPIIAELI